MLRHRIQPKLGSAAGLVTSRCPVDRPDAGAQRLENRIETLHRSGWSADHHAVAAFQPPHAAAGADVDVVDFFRREVLAAPDVVDVIRIAAVDDRIAGFHQRHELRDHLVDRRRRHHQPHGARLRELTDKVGKRRCADSLVRRQILHGLREHVEDDAIMTALDEAAHHVRAHAAQSDHSELHDVVPMLDNWRRRPADMPESLMSDVMDAVQAAAAFSKISTNSR